MVLYLILKYKQNLYTVCVFFCYCSVVLIWVEGYSYQFEMFNLRTNNSSDYIVEQSSGLLLENLNQVTGKELFKDAKYLVR